MTGLLNENAKRICKNNIDNFCRVSCPLTEPCKMQIKNGEAEIPEDFAERMNEAADGLAKKYGW